MDKNAASAAFFILFRRRKPLPFYKIEWLVAKRVSEANECDQPFRVAG
jgi:hypothetical protein